MKRILLSIIVSFMCGITMAQDLDKSKMSNRGQEGASEEARYVLGLVRNGYADKLNKYFDQEPWRIQTEIHVYKDAGLNSSLSIFCVAVDLGNIEVVKAFIEHGIGPKDVCNVRFFSSKRVMTSKAEKLINKSVVDNKSTSSASGKHSANWFGSKSSFNKSDREESHLENYREQYTRVWYGEKQVVKHHYANPLDYASGEMFDYLWSKGFRSNNLFTKQALAEAKRLDRMDVWQYIMDNKPEVLASKPSYISEGDYRALLEAAKNGPNTLAYEVLEKKLFGKNFTNSAQIRELREKLKNEMELKLNNPFSQPADTLGYSRMDKAIESRRQKMISSEQGALSLDKKYEELAELDKRLNEIVFKARMESSLRKDIVIERLENGTWGGELGKEYKSIKAEREKLALEIDNKKKTINTSTDAYKQITEQEAARRKELSVESDKQQNAVIRENAYLRNYYAGVQDDIIRGFYKFAEKLLAKKFPDSIWGLPWARGDELPFKNEVEKFLSSRVCKGFAYVRIYPFERWKFLSKEVVYVPQGGRVVAHGDGPYKPVVVYELPMGRVVAFRKGLELTFWSFDDYDLFYKTEFSGNELFKNLAISKCINSKPLFNEEDKKLLLEEYSESKEKFDKNREEALNKVGFLYK